MLDLKFIRDNPDAVRRACELKGDHVDVDRLLVVDETWRRATADAERLRASIRSSSKEIGTLMKEGKREEAEAKKSESLGNWV